MKRLLWKEFRERQWWALIWALAILGVSLFGQGQAFYGEQGMAFSPFLALPFVIGLLVGAGSYAGELARSQSVFSRPITPRAVLAAKLLFAAIVCLGMPLLAAVIAWLITSETMRYLMTPWTLLSGALGVAWLYGLCYLLGLTCSVVIPGYAGGILTLAVVVLPLIAVLGGSGLFDGMRYYGNDPDGIRQSIHYYAYHAGWIIGCWLGVTCAGLSISRFALVLSKDERVKRFTFVFVPLFIASGIAGMLLPTRAITRLFMHWEVADASFSPTGQYALVSEERQPYTFGFAMSPGEFNGSFGHTQYLVRMSDRARIPVLQARFNYWEWTWVSDDIAYAYDWEKDRLLLVYPGRGSSKLLAMQNNIRPYAVSPNRRLLLMYGQHNELEPEGYHFVNGQVYRNMVSVNYYDLRVVNLDSGQIIGEKEVEALDYNSIGFVWQDNETIVYSRMKGVTEYYRMKRL